MGRSRKHLRGKKIHIICLYKAAQSQLFYILYDKKVNHTYCSRLLCDCETIVVSQASTTRTTGVSNGIFQSLYIYIYTYIVGVMQHSFNPQIQNFTGERKNCTIFVQIVRFRQNLKYKHSSIPCTCWYYLRLSLTNG